LITQINNTRVFDFRKQLIYQLTQIDAFIREKGLATSTDIRHFTTINDNWNLAFNPARSSGSRFLVRLKPGGSIDYQKNSVFHITGDHRSRSWGRSVFIGPELRYEKFKPVNLHWQRNFSIWVSGSRTWHFARSTSLVNGTQLNSGSTAWQLTSGAGYSIQYLPNSRTIVFAGVGASIFYDEYSHEGKSLHIQPSMGLNANYFISFRTRLSVNASIQSDIYEAQQNTFPVLRNRNIYSYLSANITHTLF
jgi:hypothetical protein